MKGNKWIEMILSKIRSVTQPVEAFVICLNDSPQYVHLGTMGKAKEKLEQLAKEYYDRNSLKFSIKSYDEYRHSMYYWHIRQVDYGID